MRFSTLLAPIALCLQLVASISDSTTKGPTLFVFRTRVHPGEDPSKEGLYLGGYHIYAGIDDAVFPTRDRESGFAGFINNGTLQFELGNEFPWHLEFLYEPNTQWSSVRVIAGLPAEGVARGFAIKDHKLVADSAVNAAIEGFEGWLVCDWYHGEPQLFKKNFGFDKATANCASVDLVAEKWI